MKLHRVPPFLWGSAFVGLMLFSFVTYHGSSSVHASRTIAITDGWGRAVTVPCNPARVICSGPGCLRYLTYLQSQHRIVAVDDMEKRRERFKARPYALANPQFKKYPLFGEFRGHDNPELIAVLDPQPEVIFKTHGKMGHDPDELQDKTGIPVVVLEYGNLTTHRKDMYRSIRSMGTVMGTQERAEALIAFFDAVIADLNRRTEHIPEDKKKTCYLGGIAFKGPHGFQSTEPAYPPFLFTNSRHVAYTPTSGLREAQHADVSKEKIIEWDPEVIFIDLSTIMADPKADALYELQHDPAFQHLRAVTSRDVYGVFPYNWYAQNYGSILANAYYVGTLLYPEQFKDINPRDKANEIYTYLVGKPLFEQMNNEFKGLAFTRFLY